MPARRATDGLSTTPMTTFRQIAGRPSMRKVRHHVRVGVLGITLASAGLMGCSQPPPSTQEGDVGTIGFALQVAPGVTVNTISWTIGNTGSGLSQSGTVNVQNSNTIRFQIGGLPSGAGYTIALTATSVDGAFSCA